MEQRRGEPINRRRVLGSAALATAAVSAGLGGLGGASAVAAAPAGATTRVHAADVPGAGRFADRTVLITGGTSGIGRACAEAFAAQGARVVFCGRRGEAGAETEKGIRAGGGEATYVRADVRKPQDVRRLVERTVRLYGGLDVAMNNAGVQLPFTDLHEVSVEEWEEVSLTNVRGVFLGLKYQIPVMREHGGGVILVTSSSNEFAARAGLGSYSSSKGALRGLVQSAAVENGEHGIRVCALAPGTTDTALLDVHRPEGLGDEEWAAMKAQFAADGVTGLRRMAAPSEMARAALALASDAFSFQTGTTVVVDGGQLASL